MTKCIAIIFLSIITTVSIMAQKEIKTSITIQATPQQVWDILTNFEAYPEWNPFIKSINGTIQEGEKIKVHIEGMKFKPKVLAFKKEQEFRWKGKLLFKGLFDGEHSFVIEDNLDGSVTFKHEEQFSGILVGLFSKKLDRETLPGFKAMNEKLKELAEQKNAQLENAEIHASDN